MIHAIVQVQVEEFEPFWLYFQTRDFHLRQAQGALGSQLFRHQDDPRLVTILFQWESRRQLERFFQVMTPTWIANGARWVYPVGVTASSANGDDRAGEHALVFLQKAGELEA